MLNQLIVLAGVVLTFSTFAVVLAWADVTTNRR